MPTLDLAIRNLFAEFQEAVFVRFDLERTEAQEETLVRKTVKGKSYWYRQRYVEGQARQTYEGPSDAASDARAEAYRKARRERKELIKKMRSDEERRSAALRRAGLPFPDADSSAVLETLSSHGLIDRSGVLIGSYAFMAYAGVLGRLFDKNSVRTLDIDVLGDARLHPKDRPLKKSKEVLPEEFRPIPPLSLKQLASRFVAPNGLRIDFLVPQRGKPRPSYKAVGMEDVGAEALPFLDFLLKDPIRAVLVVPWGGVPVTVPDPCRFAAHKLTVSQRRSVTEDAKKKKDVVQAERLITACADERPMELKKAFQEAREGGKQWKKALEAGISLLPPQAASLVSRRI
ncbi:MAG TPA: GSU2403 family nucleotidyltransferase fold protein [bacterium]|nr:GSU2403 family nucleotidyltransferase fold protein [bacterium]